MNKIIFLDVDGVLNCETTKDRLEQRGTGTRYVGIDNKLLLNFKKIIDATNAKVILSSTWRDHPQFEDYLKEKLSEIGLNDLIIDKTQSGIRSNAKRAVEINHWLNDHPEIKDYIVIDDMTYGGLDTFEDRFIKTHEMIGLSEKDIEKAIAKLS